MGKAISAAILIMIVTAIISVVSVSQLVDYRKYGNCLDEGVEMSKCKKLFSIPGDKK